MSMTYAGTGVSYEDMDPFKIACQKRAALTARNAERLGITSSEWSRGESAFVFNSRQDGDFSHVEEGLGTKNLVADAMEELTGKTHYDKIAQCTVATIVNEFMTLGHFPVTCAMHLAVGDSNWFNNKKRADALVAGWGHACDLARCVWSGGETPTLKGLPYAVLSGSAVGKNHPKANMNPARIQPGDAIIFFPSSGIHANGLTLARGIATRDDGFWRKLGHLLFPDKVKSNALPDSYLTPMRDGRFYGNALLDPTHVYVGAVEDCLEAGIDIHYGVNITGHGLRKLMRAPQPLAYVVENLPPQLPIFDFIQKYGPVDDREAYGNLNMSVGYALFVPEHQAQEIAPAIKNQPFRPFYGGHIEESDQKKVVIKPKGIIFSAESLAVR